MCGVTGLLCKGGEHEYRLTKYLLSNYELVREGFKMEKKVWEGFKMG